MVNSRLFRVFRRGAIELGVFSSITNLLLLIPPLYMIQVYDRVVPSSSLETLIYITIIAGIGLAVLGALEIVRALYTNRIAARLEVELGSDAFLASLAGAHAATGDVQPLRDLTAVRTFVSSRSVFFLLDLPFAPVFLLALYFLHPVICLVAVLGTIVMIAIALSNQAATGKAGRTSSESIAASMNLARSFVRGRETVQALGMSSSVTQVWGERFADSLVLSGRVARTNAFYGGLSRSFRIMLQSGILGLGGYFVLQGQMSAGMIFAASLLSGRALQPFDQIIGGWRQIVEAGRAWRRLRQLALSSDGRRAAMTMPEPKGDICVEQLLYAPPGTDATRPLIKRLSFKVKAGESLAIIGPSRAGKSTLSRMIVGALAPMSGVVRLDGADVRHWDCDALGRNLGYMPQSVDFFPGTIADNVARFDPARSDEAVIAAARSANAHEMILSHEQGYLTIIGDNSGLSGGELQRLGLARAFYGDPRVIVLDEPTAHLDAESEKAFEQSLMKVRQQGSTVILVTHKASIAALCDTVMLLKGGRIELMGPAKEVLRRITQPTSAPVRGNSIEKPPAKGAATTTSYDVTAPASVVQMTKSG